MIDVFLQKWTESRRARFSRAIAGVCVALWVTGSVSMLYGNLAPQWTTPHCPQSHSHSTQPMYGACAWHCASIDTPSSSGRSWGPSSTPTGFVCWHPSATLHATILNGGITTRGPPRSSFSSHVISYVTRAASHEEARLHKSKRMAT